MLTGKKGATVGPHEKAACLPNATDPCFYAVFGISAATGESVHFLAPDNKVISTTAYPQNVTVPAADKTACRFPDLTGPFGLCRATPGAANAVP